MTASPPTNIYKNLLVVFAIFVVSVQLYLFFSQKGEKHNYIYTSTFDLEKHDISNPIPPETKTVVFLGTSSMAGANIPLRTTISDQFNLILPKWKSFNLAKPQSDMASVIIHYQLSLKHIKPDIAVIGITPALTPSRVGVNPVTSYHTPLLEGVVSPEVIQHIKSRSLAKGMFFLPLRAWWGPSPPSSFKLQIATWLDHAKTSLYGNLFSKNIYAFKEDVLIYDLSEKNQTFKMFSDLKKLTDQNGTRLVFYFEPYLRTKKFDLERHRSYKGHIKQIFTEQGIQYFDYSNLLESSSRHFMDYIHVTPEGHKIIAQQIVKDLELAPKGSQ